MDDGKDYEEKEDNEEDRIYEDRKEGINVSMCYALIVKLVILLIHLVKKVILFNYFHLEFNLHWSHVHFDDNWI